MGERLILFIFICLAAYRLAYLVSSEDGPFELAARWRAWLDRCLNREISPGVVMEHWIYRGFSCPLCTSFWLTLPAGALAPVWWQFPLWWLAAAGAVLTIHRGTDR